MNFIIIIIIIIIIIKVVKNKTVVYSSHRIHTDQLDFCNWLTDAVQRDVICTTLRQVYQCRLS